MTVSKSPSTKRGSRCFQRALVVFAAVVVFLSAWIGSSVFHFAKSDVEEYQKLLTSSHPANSHEKTQPSHTSQLHQKVHKQILFNSSRGALQADLKAETAELVLERDIEQRTAITERFDRVKSAMQERLYYQNLLPMQVLDYFEADKAFYNYNTQHLIAHEVKLAQYQLPGHSPIEHLTGLTPSLRATAKELDFSNQERFLTLSQQVFIEDDLRTLKAQELHIQFREASWTINGLKAEGSVIVDGPQEWKVEADEVVYTPYPTLDQKEILSPGIVTICPLGSKGKCQLRHPKGDLIKAKEILIHTEEQKVHFTQPQGVLFTKNAEDATQPIHFSSGQMSWDQKDFLLSLQDNIVIQQEGLGLIENAKEVQIQMDPQRKLQTIRCEGLTDFKYKNSKEPGRNHHLRVFGQTMIDHVHLKATFTSPCDESGKVLKGQQIFLDDEIGQIYADKTQIDYLRVDGAFVPRTIILEGRVRLVDHQPTEGEEGDPLEKYVLADKVEYTPSTKEALFTARKGERVLFFDEARDLHISAPALKIIRDPVTKQDLVKGVGDVRLNFLEKEKEQLKNHFLLSRKSASASNKTKESNR